MAERLSESQIAGRLATLPEWAETGEAIQRTYIFKGFVGAMGFVNKVAAAAEESQHHPDILVRWNKVTLTLSTHDSGGITEKDFDLAVECDRLFGESAKG